VSFVLDVPAAAAAFAAGGLVACGIGMRASWREGRERLTGDPGRGRIARALVLSWVLPGLGELYLGLPRGPALVVLAVFLLVAIPVWASLVPYVLALPFVLAVWLWGQARVRRLTGWGWWPLLPSWGELLAAR
jgi:hypothetical protein